MDGKSDLARRCGEGRAPADPFTPDQIAALRGFAAHSGRRLLHDPGQPSNTIYDALLLMPDPKPLIDRSEVALDPVSDDSPFFFQLTRWKSVKLAALRNFSSQSFLDPLSIPVGQIALVTALAIGLLLSALLLAVPLARRAVPREGRWRWLLYFLALGIAYIVVEVVLMQRFALLLGHPTYSVTAVLFAILLFSGLGSAWSDRWRGAPGTLGRALAVAVPAAILFVTFAVPPIARALMPLALAARMACAMAVVAPLAFLMGMPFPLGIRVLGGAAEPSRGRGPRTAAAACWARCARCSGRCCGTSASCCWRPGRSTCWPWPGSRGCASDWPDRSFGPGRRSHSPPGEPVRPNDSRTRPARWKPCKPRAPAVRFAVGSVSELPRRAFKTASGRCLSSGWEAGRRGPRLAHRLP